MFQAIREKERKSRVRNSSEDSAWFVKVEVVIDVYQCAMRQSEETRDMKTKDQARPSEQGASQEPGARVRAVFVDVFTSWCAKYSSPRYRLASLRRGVPFTFGGFSEAPLQIKRNAIIPSNGCAHDWGTDACSELKMPLALACLLACLVIKWFVVFPLNLFGIHFQAEVGLDGRYLRRKYRIQY